jgi:hypothetical protein
VSSQNTSFNVMVEKNITNLAVSPNMHWVGEGYGVSLSATITPSLTPAVYTWNCTGTGGQAPLVTSLGSASVIFATWGNNTCNVTAANNVSAAHTSAVIMVLQTINRLGVNGLPANSTLFVPINQDPGVVANCSTQFMVNYTWSVLKNGALFPGSYLQTAWWEANSTHLPFHFTTVGPYELHINASNAISSRTIVINVEAQEKIVHLMLHANTTSVTAGSVVLLEVTRDTGTSPVYQWRLNGTALTNVGNVATLEHTFHAAGVYVMEVRASNQINWEVVNATVVVQNPVQNIVVNTSSALTFDLNHPYIVKNQTINFQVHVMNGTSPVYEWKVLSPSGQTSVPGAALTQVFSQVGEYVLTVVVWNDVSNDSRTFHLHVEVPIASLNISVNPAMFVSTGQLVTFTGVPNSAATPVVYSWSMNGQTVATGVTYTFSFPAAGTYVLQLLAHNNISSQQQLVQVEVLDPVSGLQLSGCGVTQRAGVATTLTGSAQGTNVTYAWSVQLPTGNLTFQGPSLPMTFPAEGAYLVTLVVENKVGRDELSCDVEVQDTITNVVVTILHPPIDYIFTHQNVTFKVTGKSPSSLVYNFFLIFLIFKYLLYQSIKTTSVMHSIGDEMVEIFHFSTDHVRRIIRCFNLYCCR